MKFRKKEEVREFNWKMKNKKKKNKLNKNKQ
jgi:hypothetical protein